nr:acyltransferase family protein [Pantoea sp. 201603H]
MKFTSEEFKTITIVQAAGIFSVVIGHFYFQPFDVLQPYVYHMPLFFFLGGLLMSDSGFISTTKRTLIKHGSYLVKSYIITGVLSSLLVYAYGVEKRKPFSDGLISTIEFTIKNNFGNNPLFVVGWFLFAYIIACVICKLITVSINRFHNKKIITIVPVCIFLFLGMSYLPSIYLNRSMYLINLMAQVSTATAFMLIGNLSKDYIFKIIRFDVMAVLMLAMIFIKNIGMQKGVNIAWSVYSDGLLLSVFTTLSVYLYSFYYMPLIF